MGETDIPTEQPETEEEARFPASHAQPSRPCGDSTSPHQGPLEALGLIWRVRGQSSFRALARGRRRRGGVLEVRAAVIGSNVEPPRVAFSVGRSVGDAVTRNRVRRQLRAAVREHHQTLEPGAAYLVRATPAAAGAPYSELSSTLREILTAISDGAR
jgi:ribonuclease P protein component